MTVNDSEMCVRWKDILLKKIIKNWCEGNQFNFPELTNNFPEITENRFEFSIASDHN